MQATPATWRLLLEAGWEGDHELKVLCGGEALPRRSGATTAGDAAARVEHVRTDGNHDLVDRVSGDAQRTRAGPDRPADRQHARFTCWTAHRQPVPIGAVRRTVHRRRRSGARLLERAELTAEKFVPDPFSRSRERACIAPAIWRGIGPTASWSSWDASTTR